MPSKQVALLRGINVGKAKRVAMADLRALVTELGYRDVKTLLNSGNIVFTAPRAAGGIAARIEKEMASRLGVAARVTVVSAADLETVIAEDPFGEVADDPARYLVAFLANSADLAKLEPLRKQDWAPDALGLGTKAAYLWCAGGILESALLGAVQRALKDGVTTRNWATVTKLKALAGESGA